MSVQGCPTFTQPLTIKGATSSVWYRFFQGLYNGIPASTEINVTAGASPYTYTATFRGFMIIRGGTVTAVQFVRTQTTLTGQTQGIFPMSQGDMLVITYSGVPTLTFVPQ